MSLFFNHIATCSQCDKIGNCRHLDNDMNRYICVSCVSKRYPNHTIIIDKNPNINLPYPLLKFPLVTDFLVGISTFQYNSDASKTDEAVTQVLCEKYGASRIDPPKEKSTKYFQF